MRLLNLVCSNTHQVKKWYLGLQALAPLHTTYKSCGRLLWEIAILKINWYGLEACSDPQVVVESDAIELEERTRRNNSKKKKKK